jgi:prepilin-type N-terminal cleavage/methylation domain-containing protein
MSERAKVRGTSPEDDGFTLVEVLVALVLVGLLSLLTLEALQFGVQAWRRGSASSLKLDDRIHAEGALRQLLSQTSPRFVARVGAVGYVDFEGRAASMQLIAEPPQSLSGSGPLIFNLSAEKRGDRTDLSLASRPELAIGTEQLPARQRPLLEDVGQVEFSYYGVKSQQAEWHREWVRQTHLPDLIKITLRGATETTFVIRPQVDVDATCVHDPLSRRCRGR